MRYSRELAYDAAPDEVFAMLADPAFREKVAAAQQVVSVAVTATPAGTGLHLVIDQVQNTAGLPAIAKKIAGDTTQAVVREEWSGPASGTIEITAPGKPTRAAGTVTLVADGASTKHVVDLEVTVKVPLVGGKLEKLMTDNIDAGLSVEHSVGVAWLKGDR
ncbi:DUF2505 domain-containing protein [Nocardioides sp. WV_118_6]|uniref:DUF2505 domain-containing protein n=1 Tax=Nocardioides simplex TaxID=2045 RepID=UPI0021503FB0|nr:DUF2505 domain-containing protein [Pimelobacter simplex]UUW87161.1 DUF2505 domain-containing protein [Pimelobacter simplex]UUW96667.1 DUF2505 domain-containing protein [Pimelobacter simplex]